MPKLELPDGEKLEADEVERRFAQAMAAPEPDEPQAPAPPRKDPGQDAGPASGPAAAAPQDGSDARHSKARTTSSATNRGRGGKAGGRGKTKTAPQPAEGAYVQPVSEFLQALVIVGAATPLPPSPLSTRIRLQAQLVNEHAGGLVSAIDAGARHNLVIRRAVESLTMGSAGWVLPAVLAVAPFAAASAGLWRTHVTEDMANNALAFEAAVRAELQMTAGAPADAPAAA